MWWTPETYIVESDPSWLENVSVLLFFLDESLMKSHLKKPLCIGVCVGGWASRQLSR